MRRPVVHLIILALGVFWTFSQQDVVAAPRDPAAAIETMERARAADDGTLAAAVSGSDRALALRAALALGRTKREPAAEVLVPQLASHDPAMRAVATFALGLIARPEDLTRTRALVRSDPSSAVRYAAVDAVGRAIAAHPDLATSAVAASLADAMRDDRDPVVRAHAAAALEGFGTSRTAPAIERAIESAFAREDTADVRWHEMWVLYRAFARSIDPHFLAAQLQSRDELVRVETLRAIGKRKDAGADHFVRPLVADPSWRVQLQARETLLALAGAPATEHLTSFPPALNLPEIPAVAPEVLDATPAPARTAPALSPPRTATLDYGPPLDPQTAAEMNGPQPGPHPRVRLSTTRGAIDVRLFPEWAPVTVANFLALTTQGALDGDRWFRVVPDFVHQTGDQTNDPDHEPGYTIGAEENPVEQRSGVLAMGLDYEGGKAVRDSAGTQFYVTDSPQLHLDRDFSVFGQIERGFDVLANLNETDRILHASRLADE